MAINPTADIRGAHPESMASPLTARGAAKGARPLADDGLASVHIDVEGLPAAATAAGKPPRAQTVFGAAPAAAALSAAALEKPKRLSDNGASKGGIPVHR